MPPAHPPFDTIARKWYALARRRLAYFIELYRSGRWRHYYTEESFALRMRDVIKAARCWEELVRAQPDDKDDLRPAA